MFTDLISKKFSDAFDLDVELRDIADNSDEFPTLRALALLSIGMPLHDGYMSCRELLEILHWCADGRPEGKERLAKLLGTDCDDYQRALYYTLAAAAVMKCWAISSD
ncbi:MAG: hypothetical protein HC843_04355 [Sphingomonadales bacterium]|nr:hypothetical protein [Sphingomonadales bacterium]